MGYPLRAGLTIPRMRHYLTCCPYSTLCGSPRTFATSSVSALQDSTHYPHDFKRLDFVSITSSILISYCLSPIIFSSVAHRPFPAFNSITPLHCLPFYPAQARRFSFLYNALLSVLLSAIFQSSVVVRILSSVTFFFFFFFYV